MSIIGQSVITTFGTGEAGEALRISLPFMQAYAARHGATLIVPSDEMVKWCCEGRPPSWGKINWLRRLSQLSYASQVLWLDADVIVCRHDLSLFDQLPNKVGVGPWVSMVVQNTIDGAVPSCGVMLINNLATCGKQFDHCRSIWNAAGPDGMDSERRSSGWWEQVAMIRFLGGDPDQHPIVTPPPSGLWGQLPYEWNPHPFDPRGVPEDCRFFHATAVEDRLGAMREWAAKVKL
jgi:hypothetical protein